MKRTLKNHLPALLFLLSGAMAAAQTPTATAEDSGLIKNGDFEIGVDPAECRQMAPWTFESEEAPQSWEFHSQAGTANLVKGNAASGSRFLRIKGEKTAIIMQKIALKEQGTIQITMKLRGNGAIGIYRMCYDRQTGKYQKTLQCGENMKLNSKDWSDFSATYQYDGRTNEYLGLFTTSQEGIDIDRIVVKYIPAAPAAVQK